MSAANPPVSLNWLLDGIATLPANDAEVADLTLDSRAVRSGSLFLALPGQTSHGVAFAPEAAARGARVILWDPAGAPAVLQGPAPSIALDNPTVLAVPVPFLTKLVGRIADRYFGEPSAGLRIVGITGTNGKTTSAFLLAQCLERLHRDAGYIGTLGWGRIAALETPTHTTPDVVTLHRQLAALRAKGVRDVALEVSSQGLDQGRVDGVRFHTAAFTNLTRDHLDYHPTMAAYGAAKARLFAVPGLKHMVINIGDSFGRELALRVAGRAELTAVCVGEDGGDWSTGRAMQGVDVVLDLKGLTLTVRSGAETYRFGTRLLGRFNAENALIVIACLTGLGFSLEAAASAMAACTPPPGRLEVVESKAPGKPLAVIDYAHTPDALDKALQALREHCRGTLWCIFGCGGDRDPGKRPLMGAVAQRLADRIIVTDDNPRSEDPASIVAGILSGIARGTASAVEPSAVRVIHDRGQAIACALTQAAAADMVLIAGKGHEDYQIYGEVRRSFSDRREALRHLEAA